MVKIDAESNGRQHTPILTGLIRLGVEAPKVDFPSFSENEFLKSGVNLVV